MKKSQLRQIIKEEIELVLTENQFEDEISSNLQDKVGFKAPDPSVKNTFKPITLKTLSLQHAIDGKLYIPSGTDEVTAIEVKSSQAQSQLDNARNELVRKYGEEILNAPVIINPKAVWFDKFKIDFPKLGEKEAEFIKGKQDFLKGARKD